MSNSLHSENDCKKLNKTTPNKAFQIATIECMRVCFDLNKIIQMKSR